MKTELEWHPITERPKRSGDCLIAMKHNDVNIVLMGHYNKRDDKFSENTYFGIQVWNTRAPILSAKEMEMLEGME